MNDRDVKAPRAKKVPHTHTAHGETREDPYYWLREKENPEVIEYLKAENAYTEMMTADTKELQEDLYKEMRERIKEADISAPTRKDDYYYYTRIEEGEEYPRFCRKKGSLEADEEILLDQNELAKGKEHCSLGVFAVSPDHRLLAHAVDFTGNEEYTLQILNLETGELCAEEIQNVTDVEWKNDSRTFLYVTRGKAMRPDTVHVHTLGEDSSKDPTLFHEADERFGVGLSKSKSDRFIFLEVGSKTSTEIHVVDADSKDTTPQLFRKREKDHEYSIEHGGDCFFILSNKGAQDFKLLKVEERAINESWEEVVPHREGTLLVDVEVYKKHLVLYELRAGVERARVFSRDNWSDYYVDFDEEVYALGSGDNPEYESTTLRLGYSSMVTPPTIIDYDMATKERTIVKKKEVLGGYDASQYIVWRDYATAADGTKIPISLARHKDTKLDGTAPCLLYGYGSYGITIPVGFSGSRISLLDRGMIFALAHIRGGSDNGRGWYRDGKFLHKKNTFTDFIAVAEHLVAEKYSSTETLIAFGGSAGGMLMGAVANMRPDLFKGIVAAVPFVDIVTTMLDDSLPLTVGEYEEWGNPHEKEFYEYMRQYSPYDNVTKQAYPHMLVTAGLNDPRVQYFEPAKWVAKLRDMKTDTNLLLLKTEMGHGHQGATGRFASLKEVAFEYVFMLKVVGQ